MLRSIHVFQPVDSGLPRCRACLPEGARDPYSGGAGLVSQEPRLVPRPGAGGGLGDDAGAPQAAARWLSWRCQRTVPTTQLRRTRRRHHARAPGHATVNLAPHPQLRTPLASPTVPACRVYRIVYIPEHREAPISMSRRLEWGPPRTWWRTGGRKGGKHNPLAFRNLHLGRPTVLIRRRWRLFHLYFNFIARVRKYWTQSDCESS